MTPAAANDLDPIVDLDAAIMDLFDLDRQTQPAEDLSGQACSGTCTDDGCTRPTTC